MKSLHHNATETSLWKTYKELELIPNSVPTSRNKLSFTVGFAKAWQFLVTALTQELVYTDQQVEYLERCWAIEQDKLDKIESNSLQKLWQLMK